MDPFIFKNYDWKLPGQGQSLLICRLYCRLTKQEIDHFSGSFTSKTLNNFLWDSFLSHIFRLRSIKVASRAIKQERETKEFLILYAERHSIMGFLDVARTPSIAVLGYLRLYILLDSTSQSRRGVIWLYKVGEVLCTLSISPDSLTCYFLFSILIIIERFKEAVEISALVNLPCLTSSLCLNISPRSQFPALSVQQ